MTWSAEEREDKRYEAFRVQWNHMWKPVKTLQNLQTQSDLAKNSELSQIFSQNICFKDLQASSPILTSPGFAYVKNTLGGQANVTDTNAIPWSKLNHWHKSWQCDSDNHQRSRKVNEKSMTPQFTQINMIFSVCGSHLCTAARISGLGIISWQSHGSCTGMCRMCWFWV